MEQMLNKPITQLSKRSIRVLLLPNRVGLTKHSQLKNYAQLQASCSTIRELESSEGRAML